MDYKSELIQAVIIIALITVWAFWEYGEREARHKKLLMDLKNNVDPQPRRRENWGKVITTLVVGAFLLVLDVGGAFFIGDLGLHYGKTLIVLLAELTVFAVLLFMMAARDIRLLRKG